MSMETELDHYLERLAKVLGHADRQLNQLAHFDVRGLFGPGADGRGEFQHPHAAFAGITKPLDRVERARLPPCEASQASISALPNLSGGESASRPGRP